MATDREMHQREITVALQAFATTRNGRWINGAPSHVLAEFLSELEVRGWRLTPADRVWVAREGEWLVCGDEGGEFARAGDVDGILRYCADLIDGPGTLHPGRLGERDEPIMERLVQGSELLVDAMRAAVDRLREPAADMAQRVAEQMRTQRDDADADLDWLVEEIESCIEYTDGMDDPHRYHMLCTKLRARIATVKTPKTAISEDDGWTMTTFTKPFTGRQEDDMENPEPESMAPEGGHMGSTAEKPEPPYPVPGIEVPGDDEPEPQPGIEPDDE